MSQRKPDEKNHHDSLVLIADDDVVTRKLLEHQIKTSGFRVIVAADGKEAISKLTAAVDLALIDLHMPNTSGIEFLAHAQRAFPLLPVVMISSSTEVRDAVDAMKQGAAEYVTKPVEPDELLAKLRFALRSGQMAKENQQLRQAVGSVISSDFFSGKSTGAQGLLEKISAVAKLDSTVLLTGESGTGKTTLARRIHSLGARSSNPFVNVSCATLPRDLIEAELFGHSRGAFTGAVADRPGKAEIADGGTLFLDEIGDLPLELQPKLLTFLQDRTVQRIGSIESKRVDVRVVAATNHDLERRCRDGGFREDLFFRLSVVPIDVPPLRELAEDIPKLIQFVLERLARNRNLPAFEVDDAALALLRNHTWPGNVRELENVLERATAFCNGSRIAVGDLMLRNTRSAEPAAKASLAGMTFESIEKRAIEETLAHVNGNKKAAAKMLGIDEKSIYNKMKRLGIDY